MSKHEKIVVAVWGDITFWEVGNSIEVGHSCGAEDLFYRVHQASSWRCKCGWDSGRTSAEDQWPGPLIYTPEAGSDTRHFERWVAWWMDVEPSLVGVNIK